MRHKILLAISIRLFPAKGRHRRPTAVMSGDAMLPVTPCFSVAPVYTDYSDMVEMSLDVLDKAWPVFSSAAKAASYRRAWVVA